MADKIVVLQAGVIEQVGSPLDLYRTPRNKFVAGFIGSPKMNLIEGAEAAKYNAHTIGARPEHISVSSESGTWTGTVGVSEHLGSDTFFHVNVEGLGESITVRAGGEVDFHYGDKIYLSPDPAQIHKFDALTPGIVHIGLGNFHRAHQAWYLHRLMQAGEAHDWALIGAGVRAGDAAQRDRLAAQDYLTTLIELDPASQSAEITGAMIGFVAVEEDNGALIAQMSDPVRRALGPSPGKAVIICKAMAIFCVRRWFLWHGYRTPIWQIGLMPTAPSPIPWSIALCLQQAPRSWNWSRLWGSTMRLP